MTSRTVHPFLLALFLLCGLGIYAAEEPAPSDTGLTTLEERGKEIYVTGESPADGEIPITALLGADGVEVPGAAMPCANCHGRDGKGLPEGGVTPTNITWLALTKSYGIRHESGREHPPYTLRTLKRAIAMGIDPAGQELHAAMPRYRMSLEDMEALLAYLQKLGTDRDPGLGEETLTIGTFLPSNGSLDVVESVLEAHFAEINADGGLYGRKLELAAFRLPDDPEARRQAAAEALDATPVFALLGAVLAGADEELASLVEERQIPLVGPFTQHPRTGFGRNRYVFYLYGGLATQGRVLADLARERLASEPGDPEPPVLALVTPDDAASVKAADAAEDQAGEAFRVRRHVLPAGPVPAEDLARRARELARAGDSTPPPAGLLTLHPALLEPAFLEAAAAAGWTPELYAPGSLAGPGLFEAPGGFAGKIRLTFPSLPSDQTARGARLYGELAQRHDLPRRHLAVQLSTLASAEILVETLKRGGRNVSRESLVGTLEKLYDYETGLTPPVTYTPNRRIGAEGAYVVAVDLAEGRFQSEGGFRTPR